MKSHFTVQLSGSFIDAAFLEGRALQQNGWVLYQMGMIEGICGYIFAVIANVYKCHSNFSKKEERIIINKFCNMNEFSVKNKLFFSNNTFYIFGILIASATQYLHESEDDDRSDYICTNLSKSKTEQNRQFQYNFVKMQMVEKQKTTSLLHLLPLKVSKQKT